MSEKNMLEDCRYRHDWVSGRCNTCGCRMDWDELNSKLGTAESLVRELGRALKDVKRAGASGQVGNFTWQKLCSIIDAALSAIPKELK